MEVFRRHILPEQGPEGRRLVESVRKRTQELTALGRQIFQKAACPKV